MNKIKSQENKRILVIDDDEKIWKVYQRVLSLKKTDKNSALNQMANLLGSDSQALKKQRPYFNLKWGSQGKTGFECVKKSLEKKLPFAVAFIDIRMPPGWDGVETAKRIRKIDPNIEIVIVTAYSDRTMEEIVTAVGAPEKLLFLRKPFDSEELIQLASSLTEKWNIARREEVAKAKLIQSESRLRALVETTRDFVWETNADGIFTYCSPVCEGIYGYKPQELKGKSIFDLLYNTLPDSSFDQFFSNNSNGTSSFNNMERCIKKKNGEDVFIETSGTKVFNKSGKIIGFRGIDRDVTERKNNEEERLKLEKQYRQSQKMEAIGTLAGGIAHDFNNILSGIMGYTQLASNAIPEGDAVKRLLDNVMSASNRAAGLVHQILAFSRQTEKEVKPVSIGPVIQETLHMLRASLPSTIKIKHHIHINSEKDIILADTTQINQMLMNLCTNSAQAMKKEGGLLEVSLENIVIDNDLEADNFDLDQKNYLKITVSDTGQGMEEHLLDKIFEPFYTTKEVGEGTGLGLAVVHGIVKGHDGTIKVYSKPGEGTTFIIYLPRLDGSAEREIEAILEDVPTGNEQILFVDDEETLVEIGEELIGSLGYHVTATHDSMEALKTFSDQRDRFDLVITDMTMPEMTGETLAQKILSIRPDIPIILCSGYGSRSACNRAKDIGIREYVNKPIDLMGIAKIIRKVLDA